MTTIFVRESNFYTCQDGNFAFFINDEISVDLFKGLTVITYLIHSLKKRD